MRPPAMPALLIVLLAIACVPQVTRADALAEIDSCITRLEPNIDFGFERIAPRCPELVRALRSSEWALWLPTGWDHADNSLSVQTLAALRILVEREHALRGPMRAPEVARLRPILDALAAHNNEPRGWWQRLRNWLREVLARSAAAPGTNRFETVFGRLRLSQAVLHVVTYAIFAFVLLFALGIVVNEWRAAGLHKRLRGQWRAVATPRAAVVPALAWQDLERAPHLERPRVLLGLIAARLTALRRLPAAQALTVRELSRAAQLSEQDKDELVAVALTAERLRFSNKAAPAEMLTQVLLRGRELLQRLDQEETRA